MISFVQWLASFSAGLLLCTQTMKILKTVNEQESAAKIADHLDSAVIDESGLGGPKVLGSEQISNTLQHIMNGERHYCRVYLEAKHNNSAKGQEYALGSESLNRMLEEIMRPAENVNSMALSFEPPMDI